MERPRSVGRLGAFSTIGIVTGLVFLLGLASWLPHTLLAPFVAPQHVDRPAAGFAIAFPLDWEYADAAGADAEEWWDRQKVEDVHAYHEQVVADGGVLLARTRSPFVFHLCVLYDITDDATRPPAWTSLAHVPSDAQDWTTDSDWARDVRTTFLELPAGQALRADVQWTDGTRESSYYFMKGTRWFRLACGTDDRPPEDRWLSIAESFELRPADAPDPAPQRIERPEDGFAVTLPWAWQYADAADADPDEWWDSAVVGDTDTHHEEQRAAGLRLMARALLPDAPAMQFCCLEDFSSRAAEPPAWTSLTDPWLELPWQYEEDPAVVTTETYSPDFPFGEAVRLDVRWDDGWQESAYYLFGGTTWLRLTCWTQGEPPEDRWGSIVETFEWLPEEA